MKSTYTIIDTEVKENDNALVPVFVNAFGEVIKSPKEIIPLEAFADMHFEDITDQIIPPCGKIYIDITGGMWQSVGLNIYQGESEWPIFAVGEIGAMKYDFSHSETEEELIEREYTYIAYGQDLPLKGQTIYSKLPEGWEAITSTPGMAVGKDGTIYGQAICIKRIAGHPISKEPCGWVIIDGAV